ncbi:putative bifunctional diguanylate cyclase/phosphodiesterase [Mangrovibrevibacter kandeliae]|uniref:putative bifunctional diguanylate cyclase/phosphodiesterase n=1 Tax=Mangrovibrevibacter kandeliae TaxID=2968473 RepID=UPI0021174448|nr:EAL domain-containing protein [Aurantimonas sp. CSK15Z-1]MCQ8784151.1 EAL domain-containing protein [Aurantimonas sp. CSK15Z-1]
MNTASSGPDPVGQASLAEEALRRLNRAVAVYSRDGAVQFSNGAFDALLRQPAFASGLAALFERTLALHSVRSEDTPLSLGERRVYQIETVPLSHGVLVTASDVSAEMAERKRVNDEARTDPLTGLGNRLLLREQLAELMSDLTLHPSAAAVLTIDLDRFKAVNDTLGHPVGDALLRVVADRIRSQLGRGDVVARLGGDEFAILQVDPQQPKAAESLAARLVDLLGRSYIVDGNLLNIGASVGVALLPGDCADGDQILKYADLALYRAKSAGRGTYRFFEMAMDEEMQARHTMEIDLRRALALREFSLVYQPQVNLDTSRITGFEALLRWHRAGGATVAPSDFIPLAEEIGLINPIGEWVIRNACREAAGWSEPLTIAVNVSASQFASATLIGTVVSALAESGLAPERLELEITESVLMDDTQSVIDILHSLRQLGVRVSMDDFGTGYSSLSYLRRFPFDKIKIDQSFIRGHEAEGPGGSAIVQAIAALGRSLGMTTTAEGVETEQQLSRVAAYGCTDVQGFLFSRPLPPEKIADVILNNRAQPSEPPRKTNDTQGGDSL